MIATKQLYANHYYEASLATATVIPAPSGDAIYVTYAGRVRMDSLHGRGLLHGRIRNGIRDGARKKLEALKVRLEAAAR